MRDNQWIALTDTPLEVGASFSFLQTPDAGGIDIFAGTTRRWTGARETIRLEYDCYRPMALKEIERLADMACKRWPIKRLLVHHRLGVVPLAEVSVIIGVATPHRSDAFEACRFLIDTLKQQVPIWKREFFADGTEEWIEGSMPPDVAT